MNQREQMANVLIFVNKIESIKEQFFSIIHVEDINISNLKKKWYILFHYNLNIQDIQR